MAKIKGLGRGLDALLGTDERGVQGGETLVTLAIDRRSPGRAAGAPGASRAPEGAGAEAAGVPPPDGVTP